MYNELFNIWKKEKTNDELQYLESDYYQQLISFLTKIKGNKKDFNDENLEQTLSKKELHKIEKLVLETIELRFQKMVKAISSGIQVPSKVLTKEEKTIYEELMKGFQFFKNFKNQMIRDEIDKKSESDESPIEDTKILVRFIEDVPSLIGVDMKTYGPFKKEDIAMLLVDNAKVLIDRGAAVNIKINYQ
ncbi:DNA replication complex subunit Gins51 [[Eubacterium] cellulosolvens]